MSVALSTLHAAALMLWETAWALVLGFSLSACLQVFVRRESMTRQFGRANFRSVALATFLGAVSSSCSYAAAAAGRSAFKKGASLVAALAFMFASTNLVLELGFVLWIFLGWRFVLAEGVGAFVLIGLMWALVALLFPKELIEQARHHDEGGEAGGCHDHGHDHGGAENDGASLPFAARWRDPRAWAQVADAFFMDVSMMWKEVVIGFLIAGLLMTVVPHDGWNALLVANGPAPLRLVENCVVGVIIAVASFVCSVGNIPLASTLWSNGMSFGGVISFIYADLVIVPLLLIYRKYYGLRAAAWIAAIFAASMIGAGIVVDLLFSALGLVPTGPRPASPMRDAAFQWNYTTWLDLAALLLIAFLIVIRFRARSHESHPHQPVVPAKTCCEH